LTCGFATVPGALHGSADDLRDGTAERHQHDLRAPELMTTIPEEDPETHRIAIPIHLEPASPFRGLRRIQVGRSG
jgi:hypothetical protein